MMRGETWMRTSAGMQRMCCCAGRMGGCAVGRKEKKGRKERGGPRMRRAGRRIAGKRQRRRSVRDARIQGKGGGGEFRYTACQAQEQDG